MESELQALHDASLMAIALLSMMRVLLPGRDGRASFGDVLEDNDPTQFARVAATVVRYARDLEKLLSEWPLVSPSIYRALDAVQAPFGEAIAGKERAANYHQLTYKLADCARRYFDAIVYSAETLQSHLLQADRHKGEGERHLDWFIQDIDTTGLEIHLRHEVAAAFAVEQESDGDDDAGDDWPAVGLDRNDVAVLFCLSNREPTLQTLDDIVVSAQMSRDTASKALKELIDGGLACRPKGNRKGATVTDKGRTMAAKIRR